jgi:quercetin dioxygenase-like cupin family protein
MRDRESYERQLRAEGFDRLYVWRDGPNAVYPEHTHAVTTAHVVLAGEMTVTAEGRSRRVRAGERFDVPANTIHSARMGPEGCEYLIAEKSSG